MIFGHNTNLKVDNVTFHVQTEDRGEAHGLLDTTVYYRGRVLHRRTNAYFDLLPLDEDRLQALRLRLEDQHRTVIDEIRSGDLQLAVPSEPTADQQSALAHRDEAHSPGEPSFLALELINAHSWLAGKHAKLELALRNQSGEPVLGAQIRVEIEGSENGAPLHSETGSQGLAHIEFEMPRITAPQAALVIYAENHTAKCHLRFALKAKPRVA
ncbi:MAG: hypothetical protein WBR26_14965 [Candidatus Acidiferrum sp.]